MRRMRRGAKNGLGTVHHVAMAVAAADDQLQMREELLRRGDNVTEVRDRQYFQSIYFREPGGVLFEIATDAARVRGRRAGGVARPGLQAAALGRAAPAGDRGRPRQDSVR